MFTAAVIIFLCWFVSGCASSGLLSMSDEWCARHPEASPARCARNPGRHYDIQGHQPASSDPTHMLCVSQYAEIEYGSVFLTCWGQK
jgi:hypothetical protein